MNRLLAALTAIALAGMSSAFGADLPLTPPPPVLAQGSCDFFEAELIAYLCGHTGYVGVDGEGAQFSRTFTTQNPLGVQTQKSRLDEAFEGVEASITPWDGVRLIVSDSAFQYKNTFSQQNNFNFAPLPAMSVGSVSGSQAGWLTIGGEYTLWDRTNSLGRFITNVVAYVEHFQGGGPFSARDLQMIGWNSGAKFTLGGSGFSVNYFGNTLLQHFDGPDEVRLSSYSRLLLANDVWGVGVGPRLNTITELWHPVGVNLGWSETRLGGEILLQPFRMTQVAFLKDMTLDGYYVHTLGQAGLTPNWNGSTTSYDFGGSARFNIRF